MLCNAEHFYASTDDEPIIDIYERYADAWVDARLRQRVAFMNAGVAGSLLRARPLG